MIMVFVLKAIFFLILGDKPHRCSECTKSFITKDSLNKHMSVHITDRQYKCGECGKLFKRISHVREHLKIHSVERPFPCSICTKSFKSAVSNSLSQEKLRNKRMSIKFIIPFIFIM